MTFFVLGLDIRVSITKECITREGKKPVNHENFPVFDRPLQVLTEFEIDLVGSGKLPNIGGIDSGLPFKILPN